MSAAKAILRVVLGPHPGQHYLLQCDRTVIGRNPTCDIVLGFSAISGRHAQITRSGSEYFLEDLNSRNGSYVNGQRLQGRHSLRNSDRIDICDVVLTFQRDVTDTTPKFMFAADSRDRSIITSTLDVSSGDSQMWADFNPQDKLHAMVEIIDNLGSALALQDVLPKILDTLFAIFTQAYHGFILLKEGPDEALTPKAAKRRGDPLPETDTLRISLTIVERAIETKSAILSGDAVSDQRFEKSRSVADLHIRSMMCAPLVNSQGRVLGAIQMETCESGNRFQPSDLDMLASIARLTTFAVENAQLHELLLQQQATEKDLLLAREVQRSFLPHARPKVEGYEFFDFYEPAGRLGAIITTTSACRVTAWPSSWPTSRARASPPPC